MWGAPRPGTAPCGPYGRRDPAGTVRPPPPAPIMAVYLLGTGPAHTCARRPGKGGGRDALSAQ